MARGEAQRPRIAHRGAVEPREQGRRRLVVGDVRARIDIAVAGAMLERDAPLPPRRLRGRSRQRLPVGGAPARDGERAVARQQRAPVITDESHVVIESVITYRSRRTPVHYTK